MSLARKKPEVEKAFALVLQRMELSRDLHKRGMQGGMSFLVPVFTDVVSYTCTYSQLVSSVKWLHCDQFSMRAVADNSALCVSPVAELVSVQSCEGTRDF